MKFWLTSWLGLWALYMLLVFKTEPAEIVAGAICGGIGATGAELVRRNASLRVTLPGGWRHGVARLPQAFAIDSVRLLVVLWRVIVRREEVRGHFYTAPVAGVRGNSREAVGRRAIITFVGSIAPNTLVVGFDDKHPRVLLHELLRTDERPDVDPWAKS